jgi:hypothetical protein
MKAKHREGNRQYALSLFRLWNVSTKQDFHTLSASQVSMILEEAERVGYQKPKNANGSRARYFYCLQQRRAL